MIKRILESELNKWKESKTRKPLIIRGARQVGKTTLIKAFGQSFPIFVYLNLDLKNDLELFSSELGIHELYQLICFRKSVLVDPQRSLLVIDEIQNSPLAIKMLRYFYEEIPQLAVIAAGSLLETVINKDHLSFPVGRVENLWLHPLNFEEYLGAIKHPDLLAEYHSVPVQKNALIELKRHFKTYSMLGGMPEIVLRYLENQDMVIINRVFESLIRSYLEDVDKYAGDKVLAEAISHVLNTAFAEAGKRITLENFGNSNYRSQTMKEAFSKLERAQLLRLMYPVTATAMPQIPNYRRKPRLQMLDTGLLNYQLGIQEEFFFDNGLTSVYKGIIIQHLVGQELDSLYLDSPPKVTFWIREKHQSSAEVDFVFPYKGNMIPIEVKSGATGSLRSLHQYMASTTQKLAVRIYEGEPGQETVKSPMGDSFLLLNLPLCLAGKIKEYLDYYH